MPTAAGFHFGHDAGAVLMDEAGLRRFLDKERRSRVKHAMGLSSDDLREILADCPEDMLIGVSSTQEVPLFLDAGVELALEGATDTGLAEYLGRLRPDHHYRKFTSWMGDASPRGLHVRESLFAYRSRLNEGFNRSYEALSGVAGQFASLAEAQHRDGTLSLDGVTRRARFYQHHYLHAWYAAWATSPSVRSLVITGDGGVGPSFFGGGIYFWTPGQKLLPVTPIDGWLGDFYDNISVAIGLEESGGAGKLMGLAPYGRPLYYDDSLVGTRWQVTDGYELSMPKVIRRWLARFDIDARALPRWDAFAAQPPVLIADIAASAQLVLEKNLQRLGEAAVKLSRRAGFAYDTVTLCGGTALNCPANSNLAVTLDKPVLAPPAVNDEGLSLGAAVAAYFDAFGKVPAPPADYAEAVYIGSEFGDAAAVAAAADRHGFACQAGDAIPLAAERLLADEIVALCAGRAEVGPRALGHRSILANPASPDTWLAVNRLKRREPWRPFAPAVLMERSADYFDRGPAESRYMLFNYRCGTKRLPAVTHYDHSARLQHVSPETGPLYDLLKRLESLGAAPVLLNTSFNGPGVPIVDTAEDAFAEAARLGLVWVLTEFGLYGRRDGLDGPVGGTGA